MNKLIAIFFGKPKSKKLTTKYLAIETGKTGFLIEKFYNSEISRKEVPNSLVCNRFDNRKDLDKWLMEDVSKNQLKAIEIYQLTPLEHRRK